MDQTTFMIFDELTSNLGRNFSIHSLTNEIKKDYNTGYYKNIYDKIIDLKQSNDILLDKIGRSSIINLNFKNYDLLNLLSQFELIKKRKFTKDDKELGMLLSEMNTLFNGGFCTINSISIINLKRNKSLNRAEFLFIQKDLQISGSNGAENIEKIRQEEIFGISEIIRSLEKIHNLKIDYLILSESEFNELIKETDHNPIKEMISSQIVLTNQENFWLGIKKIIDNGIIIKSEEDINPAKISEEDLIYNLSRFGYKELGAEIGAGKDYCLETIITSLLLKKDARRIEAIPLLIRKNLERGRKPIFNLLIFLARKYNKSGKLMGLLKSLSRYNKDKPLVEAIELMQKTGIAPEEIDEEAIEQKMRLYYGD
jgi:hypothetical protein